MTSVSTPRELLVKAGHLFRLRPGLSEAATQAKTTETQYVLARPHLGQWPLQHLGYLLIVLACGIPLVYDPLLVRPFVEQLLDQRQLDAAGIDAWTIRIVVGIDLLIAVLAWLGASRADGRRLRIAALIVGCVIPVIALAVALQVAATEALKASLASGTDPAAPTLWGALTTNGNLGLIGMTVVSMVSHMLVIVIAPHIVEGIAAIGQAIKWVFSLRPTARRRAGAVTSVDRQIDALIGTAWTIATKLQNTVGATGLRLGDLAQIDVRALLSARNMLTTFEALCDDAAPPPTPSSGGGGGAVPINGSGPAEPVATTTH